MVDGVWLSLIRLLIPYKLKQVIVVDNNDDSTPSNFYNFLDGIFPKGNIFSISPKENLLININPTSLDIVRGAYHLIRR